MTSPEAADRSRIIACAKEWLGTPFHDDARLKGVGVDCAQLIAAAYLESEAVPHFETPRYQAQWFMNRSEERLMNFVISLGGKEIPEERADRGDLVLYKLAHCFAHAAVIVEWRNAARRRIIHAHKLSGLVIEMAPFEMDLRGRQVRFFSLWG